MNSFGRSLAVGILAATTFQFPPQNASALGPGACDAYATIAVNEAKRAESMNCGLSGPEWSTDRNQHLRWCRSIGKQSTANNESIFRQDALSRCPTCNDYAAKAANAQRDNVKFHCGFTGPVWQSDQKNHYNWCMGEHRDYTGLGGYQARNNTFLVGHEEGRRATAIQQCKSKFTDEQIAACVNYSKEAVKQSQFNAERQCGLIGERWSLSEDAHFAWCTAGFLAVPDQVEQAMQRESDMREDGNRVCAGTASTEYGGCPGCSRGTPGALVPEKSSGPSPFGDKALRAGSAGTDRSKSAKPTEKIKERRSVERTKTAPGTASSYTVQDPASMRSNGRSAMDRLGGGANINTTATSPRSAGPGVRSPSVAASGTGSGSPASAGGVAIEARPSRTIDPGGAADRFRAPR